MKKRILLLLLTLSLLLTVSCNQGETPTTGTSDTTDTAETTESIKTEPQKPGPAGDVFPMDLEEFDKRHGQSDLPTYFIHYDRLDTNKFGECDSVRFFGFNKYTYYFRATKESEVSYWIYIRHNVSDISQEEPAVNYTNVENPPEDLRHIEDTSGKSSKYVFNSDLIYYYTGEDIDRIHVFINGTFLAIDIFDMDALPTNEDNIINRLLNKQTALDAFEELKEIVLNSPATE